MALDNGSIRIIGTFTQGSADVIAKVVQHGLIGDGDSVVIENPTDADLTAVGRLWAGAWRNTIALRTSDQVQLSMVEVVDIFDTPAHGVVKSAVNTGVSANDTEINAACIITQWRTGIVAKNANGRTYWPGVPVGEVTDGRTVASSPYAQWTSYSIQFFNALVQTVDRDSILSQDWLYDGSTTEAADVANYTFGLKVGRERAGSPPYPTEFADVVGVTVNPLIGIQRRRMK